MNGFWFGYIIGLLVGYIVAAYCFYRWTHHKKPPTPDPHTRGLDTAKAVIDFTRGLQEGLERFEQQVLEGQAKTERKAEASEREAIERAKGRLSDGQE